MPTNTDLTFLLIPVAGEPTVLTAPADQTGAYNTVRAAVGGGYLEALSTPDRSAMLFVDEDGKQRQLPRNPRATDLMNPVLRAGDFISGPAVLTGPETADGEWSSVDLDVIREHYGITVTA